MFATGTKMASKAQFVADDNAPAIVEQPPPYTDIANDAAGVQGKILPSPHRKSNN